MMSPVQLARDWADYYRSLGWNPLPSGPEGYPRIAEPREWGKYRHERDNGMSPRQIDAWSEENVQLVCGVRWGLMAVDLDGPLSVDLWECWSLHRDNPPTWRDMTPSGGMHLIYRIPPGVPAVPSRISYRFPDAEEGKYLKHEMIEILGDKKLVRVPPSVKKGRRYRWICGPRDMDRPAFAPKWILDLPDVNRRARPRPDDRVARRATHGPRRPGQARYRYCDVLGEMSRMDRLAELTAAGLRLADTDFNQDWIRCHAVGRPDVNPSATINLTKGIYTDHGESKEQLRYFDLIGRLRGIASEDARDQLGDRYCRRAALESVT